MKIFLTIFLFLFIFFNSYGQGKNQNLKLFKMSETDSLYITAIEKYILEIDLFYNKYSQTKQPKTIFIEYQDYLSKIPDSIDGYQIKKMGLGNRKKMFRENKSKFRYVKIFPLTIDEGRFSITIIPYFAELKRKDHLFLSLSDWTTVFFEFKNGRLKYEKTINDGM